MDFKTFKEEVKENVRAHLPKEAKDVELSFGTYQKMNYSYEALFINIPEKNAQVSINLDELYEAYKDGQDLSKFYEIIPEIVESKEVDRAKEISFDYEQVKSHLFIRVDRVEGNENILENTKGEEYGGRYELIAGNCLIGPTSENPYLTKPAVSQAIKDAKNYLEQKEKSHEKQGKHLKITERSKTLPTKKVKEQER